MRFIVTIFIVILIQGCATAPMAPIERDTSAKSFDAVPEKSNLYIYRNEIFGGAISMDVSINGKEIGKTAAKTYFKLELAPGKYQVQSKSENTSTIDIILSAGQNTFLWQEVKMGLIYARTKLAQVDNDTGQKGVLESKLIASVVDEREIMPISSQTYSDGEMSTKLKELKKMFDEGIINQDEYDLSKSKVLGNL